jgi:hypothetical protein
MKTLIKHIFRLFVLGTTYGFIYMGIEMIYRQRTTLSMGVLAFILGILIGLINEIFTWDMSLLLQSSIGMIIATIGELICGQLINKDHSIWSYLSLPFNFFNGQICLYFSICWFFIALLCILLDDWLREVLFDEERKKYNII